MHMNKAGLDLVKTFEGLELKAYPDPGTGGDPWTIGYGATRGFDMKPIRRGMKITKAQAEQLLIRDLREFEDAVLYAVKRDDLSQNQFSALVSFCFNVGPGNFRKSSVLKAVNAGDDESVPRRLSLWVKAAGRTLPGLVKRRAAEGNLYMKPDALSLYAVEIPEPTKLELQEMKEARAQIGALVGKPMKQSTTVWATLASAGAGIVATGKELYDSAYEYAAGFLTAQTAIWFFAGIGIAGAAVWVIRERARKAADDAI